METGNKVGYSEITRIHKDLNTLRKLKINHKTRRKRKWQQGQRQKRLPHQPLHAAWPVRSPSWPQGGTGLGTWLGRLPHWPRHGTGFKRRTRPERLPHQPQQRACSQVCEVVTWPLCLTWLGRLPCCPWHSAWLRRLPCQPWLGTKQTWLRRPLLCPWCGAGLRTRLERL